LPEGFVNTMTTASATPEATSFIAQGLSSEQARKRLQRDGPNAMPDTSIHSLRNAATKFWAPVPWLLEGAIMLQVVLHKYDAAAVIAGLLIFNAALAYFQESRAQATLSALKSQLAMSASVQRDGQWTNLPASELVCGDLVKLSLGGVVAADVHLLDGSVSLDQSMLTGESLPIEAGRGSDTYAGALVRRGEATAEVTATGARTKFGRTAELILNAHVVSSQQKAVLTIVRNLAIFNGCVILLMAGYAYMHSMSMSEAIPLLLTTVLAAIPVALPATFTLAAALGARALAKVGVLPTRLSAVDEAASIDVLCSDKTGTLTRNELSVTNVQAMPGFDEAHVLGLAALASSDGGQDSVDAAIRAASLHQPASDLPQLNKFVPFDPAKKIAEATATDLDGVVQRIIKGAFSAVIGQTVESPAAATMANALETQGLRVLAVAAGPATSLRLIGFIALSDPPRDDSAALISELKSLGVRTVMVTGDAPATAAVVARVVGLIGPVCPPGPIPGSVQPKDYSVFASILPEGKFNLVKAFQKSGHIVGMCGDGANDAPALRQAHIGVAVSSATDVAKSAADVVLTDAGLAGIVAAVKEGRITYQRILSYTLRSVSAKIGQVLLLAIGLLITGHAVLTPTLMVIVMITGDFLAMSLTTDRVRPSATPNSWQIGRITAAGVLIGSCLLLFSTAMLVAGKYGLDFGLAQLQTMTVVALINGAQAVTYAIRERRHLLGLRPTSWIVLSSVANILIISTMAVRGLVMAPIPLSVVACEFAAAIGFFVLLDMLKIPVFARLRIS
jgi:H+-transporting ATPase